MTTARCADVSEAAGEPISATVPTVENWLLVEVRGTWPRDVSDLSGLDEPARQAVTAWLESTPRPRLMFIRRPGRRQPRQVRLRDSRRRARDGRSPVRPRRPRRARGRRPRDRRRRRRLAARARLRARHARRVLRASRERRPRRSRGARAGGRASGSRPTRAGTASRRTSSCSRPGSGSAACPPTNARSAVEEVLAGRIPLEHYRGRTAYTARVQAAEHAVRDVGRVSCATDDLALVEDDGIARALRGRGRERPRGRSAGDRRPERSRELRHGARAAEARRRAARLSATARARTRDP